MNPLTKEQVEEIASYIEQYDVNWTESCVSKNELVELLRGYRAWLAEVEYHEAELRSLHPVTQSCLCRDTAKAAHFNIQYHRARLAALKGTQ